jgi:hypothetical protein
MFTTLCNITIALSELEGHPERSRRALYCTSSGVNSALRLRSVWQGFWFLHFDSAECDKVSGFLFLNFNSAQCAKVSGFCTSTSLRQAQGRQLSVTRFLVSALRLRSVWQGFWFLHFDSAQCDKVSGFLFHTCTNIANTWYIIFQVVDTHWIAIDIWNLVLWCWFLNVQFYPDLSIR